MAYSVPSLLISQEFNANPAFTTSPLSALIIGEVKKTSDTNHNVATVATLGSVNTTADIVAAVGDIVAANPLAYALQQAIYNSNGATVYYISVPKGTGTLGVYTTPAEEAAEYAIALSLAEKGQYYGIVPLTETIEVITEVVAHCNLQSSPAKAHWRTCWVAPAEGTGADATAKTADYITKLSFAGTVEGATDNSGPRRVHVVFPPTYTSGATTGIHGYHMAAALAGVRSGSAPHQSLTNTQVIGPTAVPLCTATYSETNLNSLAAAGVWIVTQAPSGGQCYTRHQLTGDASGILNYREDSVVANVDSISYGLQSALAHFVGIYNISPGVLLQIKSVIDAELSYRLTGTYTARAGNQLLGYKIVSITQNATYADQLDIVIQLQVPYPMNHITVTLTV
jgi:hypothetical protein